MASGLPEEKRIHKKQITKTIDKFVPILYNLAIQSMVFGAI